MYSIFLAKISIWKILEQYSLQIYWIVHVAIHFWSFWMEAILNMDMLVFFYSLSISVLPLEILICGDSTNHFNPATFLCHSQARTLSCFVFNGLKPKVVVCFVDNGGIVEHHCSIFFFIMQSIITCSIV
jgi:hypothetical protein